MLLLKCKATTLLDKQKAILCSVGVTVWSSAVIEVQGTTLLDKQKAILCSVGVTAWSSCKAIWALHIECNQDLLTDNDKSDPKK